MSFVAGTFECSHSNPGKLHAICPFSNPVVPSAVQFAPMMPPIPPQTSPTADSLNTPAQQPVALDVQFLAPAAWTFSAANPSCPTPGDMRPWVRI